MIKKETILSLADDSKRSEYVRYGLLFVFAFLIFGCFYGFNVIDPCYTDWLMLYRDGDVTQHYLGWVAFRNSSWSFPIGLTDRLLYPSQSSVIFTDSIPLLAIPFKLLSPILPDKFQYFGLWGVGCFFLQAFFTYRILRVYAKNRYNALIASLMFIILPCMFWRMFLHTALAGQWMLIMAISCLLDYKSHQDTKKMLIFAGVLGFLTSSVHIYLVLMCGMIFCAYFLLDTIATKRPLRSLLTIVVFVLSAAFFVWLYGGFIPFDNMHIEGLGIFSFNLDSFFNSRGLSRFFAGKLWYDDRQYEGFSYLGLGFISLILTASALFIADIKEIRKNVALTVSLSVLCLISIFLAVSPIVTYGTVVLFEYKLPEKIFDIFSIFRCTGRLIWILVYTLCIGSFIILFRKTEKRFAMILTSILLLVAIVEFYPEARHRRQIFGPRWDYVSVYDTDDLMQNADLSSKKHLVYLDFGALTRDTHYDLTSWALRKDMTVNCFYFARQMESGFDPDKGVEDDALYVFSSPDVASSYADELILYQAPDIVIGVKNELKGADAFRL